MIIFSKAPITPRLTAFAAALWLVTASVLAQPKPASQAWAIVPGETALEHTAARDLARYLETEQRIQVLDEAASPSADVLVAVGTIASHPTIAAAHAKQPFQLDPSEAESYHIRRQSGDADTPDHLFIVGQSSKGAMNGVFRFIDRNDIHASAIDEAKSPVFRYRAAGHKINQSPPPDWSEEDQARFYARNYINLVWGEKHGPPMSLEARQKYGLGLMIELRIPMHLEPWMDDPAYADAVYFRKRDSSRRVMTPFGKAGRRAYLEAYQKLLHENPDTRLLYLIAGDYNVVPHTDSIRISDGQAHPQSRPEVILEILDIAREAVGDRDILIVFWPWHAFYGQPEEEREFLKALPDLGYGVFYNEAGNNDNWIYKLDNFNDTALLTGPDGKTAYGDNYVSLVSAGGACESTNPVMNIALPRVAAYKLSRLAEVGARHFALWWGSGEGWAYNTNIAAIRNMIWEPELFDRRADAFDAQKPSPLLRRIAEQDFGPAADDVMEYWRLLDEALVTTFPEYRKPNDPARPGPAEDGLNIYSWYQRMGTYTEAVFGGAYPEPIIPATMADAHRFRSLLSWGAQPGTQANFAAAIANMARAGERARQILDRTDLPAHVRDRVQEMHDWNELFRLLLQSQLNHMRALRVMADLKSEDPESDIAREKIAPITRDQIRNSEALIELIDGFAPNFNIRQSHSGVVASQGDRESEISLLQGKIRTERMWLDRLTDIALGKPVKASSHNSEERRPEFVTDGSDGTLWHSRYADGEWIYVDLERVTEITGISLHWRTAFATEYEVAVATDLSAPSPWTVVHHETNGQNATAHIDLSQGVKARYVRMRGLRRGSPYGFALTRFAVFGVEN